MIASGAVPALLPAHTGVSQTSRFTTQPGLCRHPAAARGRYLVDALEPGDDDDLAAAGGRPQRQRQRSHCYDRPIGTGRLRRAAPLER
jgi:hypothetical protein